MSCVGVFFLVISAGLFGNQRYDLNIAPTLVWVIWWVGLAYASALIGNIWTVLNPWKIIFDWAEKLYQQFGLGEKVLSNYFFEEKLGVIPSTKWKLKNIGKPGQYKIFYFYLFEFDLHFI